MKIAVVGSREFKYQEFVQSVLNDYLPSMSVFISGGAKGVDLWAEQWIDEYNTVVMKEEPNLTIAKIVIEPDWKKYGKSAGFIRNELIIKQADLVICIWDGKSKGTKHDIDIALKMKKDLDIYVRQ